MWSYFKLTIWAILWLLLWVVIAPFRGSKDNCLTWAMRKHDEEGGYLVIRWCRTNKFRWIKWPHFMWLDKKHHKHLKHCIPKEDATTDKFIPHPWFHGRIKKGDSKEDGEEN
jgi:hypothetical protein